MTDKEELTRGDALAKVAALEAELAQKSLLIREMDLMFGRMLLGMRAAVIEEEHGKGAENAMMWIFNGLVGPGELPPEEEKDAQAYFDREVKAIDEGMKQIMEERKAMAAAPAPVERVDADPTTEYVWVRLLDNMVADNGGPYLSSTADFDEARPAIAALIEAGFFRGDPSDLDSDFWQAVGGEVDEANERFASQAEHYRVLDDVLHRVFETPADFPAPVERVEQEPVAWLEGEPSMRDTVPTNMCFLTSSTMIHTQKPKTGNPVWPLYTTPQPAAPAPDVAGLEFTLAHPDGEKHTVMLTKDEVRQYMVDEIYEKLGALVCSCEPVGETNVCDCNCIDRIEQFEIAAHQQPAPTIVQDVAGLVEAARKADDILAALTACSKPIYRLERDLGKGWREGIYHVRREITTALAAHQQREGE